MARVTIYSCFFVGYQTSEDKVLAYHRIVEADKFAYALKTKMGDPSFADLSKVSKIFIYLSEIQLTNSTQIDKETSIYGFMCKCILHKLIIFENNYDLTIKQLLIIVHLELKNM